jgi:hypothetical protein
LKKFVANIHEGTDQVHALERERGIAMAAEKPVGAR